MNDTNPNPYVGPRTYRMDERDLFFGREREALDLLSLVISERLVLFYAQSGAGKSSLINAKLIPGLLMEEECRVLPVGRIGGSDSVSGNDIDNIYVYNLISSLVQYEIRQDVLSKLTLTKILSGLGIDLGQGLKQVLIIDQFEELFSTHQEAWKKREDFFRQLAQTMQDFPNLWVVLVMREDYIASLDPYVHLLLGKLRVRYYMQRLSHEAALEAVKQPAAKANRPFDEGVAEKLVNDLSSVKVRKPDETLDTQIGQYVEPVQLQVICSSLWEKLPANDGKITQDYVDQYVGDVNQALGNYYQERVKTVAEGEEAVKKEVTERDIREWFGRKLITADGIRNLVAQEPGKTSGGLDDDVIQEFVKRGDLVRAEQRGGATFYELTHDRLVEPILADNRKWEEAHTNVLQRQAALWDQQGRPEGLLLRGQELANIEKSLTGATRTKVEQDFLSACRALQVREERERRQKRLITIFSIVATIAFVVAVFFGIQAVEQRNRARDLAQIGLARQLAEQSKAQSHNSYELSILLGIEAYRLRNDIPEARSNLLANLNSPNLIKALTAHQGPVKDVIFSPDGRILASGSEDDKIIFWDVSNPQSPTQLGILENAHAEGVESMAFSPDGKTLASGSLKEIILWDASEPSSPNQRGEPLVGHESWVDDLAFSPDGKTLASGSFDTTIILWDVSDLSSPKQHADPLLGHEDRIRSLAFTPDGKTLASGSDDKSIRLWDVVNPQAPTPIGIWENSHSEGVGSITFSPDGKIMASGSWEEVKLWEISDPASPQPLLERPLEVFEVSVEDLAFSLDGRTLAMMGEENTITLWDVSDPSSPRQQGPPLVGHADDVKSLAISPDGQILASGSDDTSIRLWTVSNLQAPTQLGGPLYDFRDQVNSVMFSRDAQILASGSDDATVILWDVSNPQAPIQLSTLSDHTDDIRSVVFSPDSKILASSSDDKTIILWDLSNLESPTRLGTLSAHTESVYIVAFHPDGQILASGSEDQTIILWDVSDPRSPILLSTLLGHIEEVNTIAFSPDGQILASGSDDDTIFLWDVSNPQFPTQLSMLSYHIDDVKSVAFSPDPESKILASGSDDDTVILWDISDPRLPTKLGATLTGHTSSVESVAFSSDGNTLASGSLEILLWDITNPSLPVLLGKPLAGHTRLVLSIALDANGKILASGSRDNTIRLWDIDSDSWIMRICAMAGRNLTSTEWATYLPGEEYHVTCPPQLTPTALFSNPSATPPASPTAQATAIVQESPTAPPTVPVSPTTLPPPLLTGEVTSCDPSTYLLNFRMVESPPVLTEKELTVHIADQEASCFINPVNTSLLSCTITDYVTFPVTVLVRLDGAVVNEFPFFGLGCDLAATPIP